MSEASRSAAAVRYWRTNLRLTTVLLLLWGGITFAAGYYAVELNRYTFLDFPLGFYTFAQGTLIVYLVIIAVYVHIMNRLDQASGYAEDGATAPPR